MAASKDLRPEPSRRVAAHRAFTGPAALAWLAMLAARAATLVLRTIVETVLPGLR